MYAIALQAFVTQPIVSMAAAAALVSSPPLQPLQCTDQADRPPRQQSQTSKSSGCCSSCGVLRASGMGACMVTTEPVLGCLNCSCML
jgi:hypothetical protein